jgi:hypothetical protein
MNPEMRAGGLVAKRLRRYVPLAAVLLACAAHAQQGEGVPSSEVGHSAAAWLELQRSNAAAAPALPTLGAEAGYAWQRYMKSFETPIPPSFGSSVESHGGSAQGAAPGEGGAY